MVPEDSWSPAHTLPQVPGHCRTLTKAGEQKQVADSRTAGGGQSQTYEVPSPRAPQRWRRRNIAIEPFRDGLYGLLILDPVQDLAPDLGPGEGFYYGVALAFLLAEGFDLMAQAFLGLAHGHFVYTLDILLRFTSATGLLAVALHQEIGTWSARSYAEPR